MKYDIIVVGSGPGGYVAAIRASQLGRKVALVERAEAGGVCLNWGCIPTKALLKSAQVYTYCKSAAHYGLDLTGEVKPDLEKIVARSRGVAETMSKGVAFLLGKNNIDLIPGFGRLTAPGKLDVDGTEYEADHIVLATGARPREMAFMPIDGERVISSRQALTLAKLPETMVLCGAGGQSHRRGVHAPHDAAGGRRGVEDHGARIPQTARCGADIDDRKVGPRQYGRPLRGGDRGQERR